MWTVCPRREPPPTDVPSYRSLSHHSARGFSAATPAVDPAHHISVQCTSVSNVILFACSIQQLLVSASRSAWLRSCANFEMLCTGSNPKKLTYEGSVIHRIMHGGWIQGGDIVTGSGVSGASAYGQPLPDENFSIPHDQPGVLGMANTGPHSALSQFYVTTRELPAFDNKFVAFGRVIDGMKLLDFMSQYATAHARIEARCMSLFVL